MDYTLGRVGIVARGVYDEAETYDALDLVSYNGASYIAKETIPEDTPPTNAQYWICVSERGEAGKTAYQYAVEGGYTKSEAEFYADLAMVSQKQDAIELPLAVENGGTGAAMAAAARTNLEIQSGVTVVPSVPGTSGKTVSFTFPRAFSVVPMMMVNVNAVNTSVNGYFSYAGNITRTGCSLSVVRSGGSGNSNVSVSWIAIAAE